MHRSCGNAAQAGRRRLVHGFTRRGGPGAQQRDELIEQPAGLAGAACKHILDDRVLDPTIRLVLSDRHVELHVVDAPFPLLVEHTHRLRLPASAAVESTALPWRRHRAGANEQPHCVRRQGCLAAARGRATAGLRVAPPGSVSRRGSGPSIRAACTARRAACSALRRAARARRARAHRARPRAHAARRDPRAMPAAPMDWRRTRLPSAHAPIGRPACAVDVRSKHAHLRCRCISCASVVPGCAEAAMRTACSAAHRRAAGRGVAGTSHRCISSIRLVAARVSASAERSRATAAALSVSCALSSAHSA